MTTQIYLITVFCLLGFTVVYLRRLDVFHPLNHKSWKNFLKWLGIAGILFQVLYGGVDIVTGLIAENVRQQSPIVIAVRAWLSLPVLSNLAWLTDLLISWWAYVFFASILLGDAAESFNKAFKLGTIALHFSLLFSLVQLLSWDEISIGWTIIVATAEMSVVLHLLKGLTRSLATRHRDLPLLLSPILLPMLEPLLGNAFQFLGFLAILVAAFGRKGKGRVGLNRFLQSSEGQWSRWALIYLISLGIPSFLIVASHMTMVPPVMMQFEKPVTILLFWQIPVLLLVLLVVRGKKTQFHSLLLVVIVDLLVRVLILPWYLELTADSRVAGMLNLFHIGGLIYGYQFVFQLMILVVVLVPTGFDPGEQNLSQAKLKCVYWGRLSVRLLAQCSLFSLVCVILWQIANVFDVDFVRERIPGGRLDNPQLIPMLKEKIANLQWIMVLGCTVLAFFTSSAGADSPRKFARSARLSLPRPEYRHLLILMRDRKFSGAYWAVSYLLNMMPVLLMAVLALAIWFRLEANWEAVRVFLITPR